MKSVKAISTADPAERSNSRLQTVRERMHLLLSDGEWHTKEELHACLWDELSPLSAIFAHLTALRKEYNERGDDLVSERSQLGIRYRWAKGHLIDSSG